MTISDLEKVFRVPQGAILSQDYFILLDSIIFADIMNLFFIHKKIKKLFNIANLELSEVLAWFNADKLSLNKAKTKYVK